MTRLSSRRGLGAVGLEKASRTICIAAAYESVYYSHASIFFAARVMLVGMTMQKSRRPWRTLNCAKLRAFASANWPGRSGKTIQHRVIGKAAATCRAPMCCCRWQRRSASAWKRCSANRQPRRQSSRAARRARCSKPFPSCPAASKQKILEIRRSLRRSTAIAKPPDFPSADFLPIGP